MYSIVLSVSTGIIFPAVSATSIQCLTSTALKGQPLLVTSHAVLAPLAITWTPTHNAHRFPSQQRTAILVATLEALSPALPALTAIILAVDLVFRLPTFPTAKTEAPVLALLSVHNA